MRFSVRFPFKIYEPTNEDGTKTLLSSGDLGFAFSGSAIGALTFKETVGELIYEMQHMPDRGAVGMDAISEFVFGVYKIVSKNVIKHHNSRK